MNDGDAGNNWFIMGGGLKPPFHSPPRDCKYIFVRDNVPQGLAAVMLASSEMEY